MDFYETSACSNLNIKEVRGGHDTGLGGGGGGARVGGPPGSPPHTLLSRSPSRG